MGIKEVRLWLLAVMSGLLMALSSAPYDQWYLAYVAYIPLFIVTQNVSVQKQGLAFALACSVIAANWWHSVFIFSAAYFVIILLVLCFSFYLWAILSAPFRTEKSNPFLTLFMPAVIWVGIERILSSEWIGIVCNIGITQSNQPVIIQTAAWFGVYTTSFLIVLSNTSLAMLLHWLINKKKLTRQQRVALSTIMLLMILNAGYGMYQLSFSVKPVKPIKIAMIQPVISSNLYINSWRNPESREFVRKTLDELTNKALETKPDLLVWPEGGNGYLNMRINTLRNKLYTLAKDNKTALLIASNDLDEEGRKYNSIFSISNTGKYLDRYDKVMLIPGAEDRYTAGNDFRPVETSFGMAGASICYESIFPSPLRKLTAKGAELLVVSTSDAALKKTSLTLNHTRTAIFRAIENNRWIVHASNTGPSVIVSPQGKIMAQSGFYKRGFIEGQVEFVKEKSLFTLYGYLIPITFSFFVLVLVILHLYKFYKARSKNIQKTILANKKEPFQISRLLRSVNVKHILPAGIIHILFIMMLVYSSILIVYRMTPSDDLSTRNNRANSSVLALRDFFEPLDTLAADKVGDKFMQASSNTCGPAALAYMFSYYGHEILEPELVAGMSITEKGTSMLELKKTAIASGFQSRGVRENYAALLSEPLPVIAFINESHYVVINKVTPRAVYLFDPLLGHVELNRKVFEKEWNGYLLLIRMKKISLSVI